MTTGSGLSINPGETNLTKIVQVVRQLIEGRSNAVGSVSLAHDGIVTTTTVSAPTCGPNSVVKLTPQTANAAAVVATTYVSSVASGQFVITHVATSQTDQTFGWHCVG